MLSVNDILSASDLKEETVDVPEWGGQVKIRGLSLAASQAARDGCTVVTWEKGKRVEKVDEKRAQLAMFVAGVIEPAFTMEHMEALKDKAAGPVNRIIARILYLSGMTEESQHAADKSNDAESGSEVEVSVSA